MRMVATEDRDEVGVSRFAVCGTEGAGMGIVGIGDEI